MGHDDDGAGRGGGARPGNGTGRDVSRAAASSQFTQLLEVMIQHHGLDTERALIRAIGRSRLKALRDGAESTFAEASRVSQILQMPLAAFCETKPAEFEAVGVAYAHLCFALTQRSVDVQKQTARRLMQMAEELLSPQSGGQAAVRSQLMRLLLDDEDSGGGHA